MKNNTGFRTILEDRYDRGDHKFPVKIAVTFLSVSKGKKKWIPKYYPLGFYLTHSDFQKVMGNGRLPDKDLSRIRDEIQTAEAKAKTILDGSPSPEQFKMLFSAEGGLHNVIDHLERYAKQCEEEGRISSRDAYYNAAASLTLFTGSKYLTFAEVTVSWLKRYEKWMLDNGKSINTVGIYLRNLRAIFNQVIHEPYRLIPAELYPFSKNGYTIKRKRGGKWAPSGAEISKILKYQPIDEVEKMALAFWKFSYFAYGLNPADIVALRFKHIKNGELHIDRTKTIRTEHNAKTILIPVHEEMQRVINQYGNKSLDRNEYIFPILTKGLSPKQMKDRLADFRYDVNEGLKAISEKLGLSNTIKFGIARHAFATTLMRKGITTEFIQNALGHSNPDVTQNYLDGFDTDTRRKVSDLLAG